MHHTLGTTWFMFLDLLMQFFETLSFATSERTPWKVREVARPKPRYRARPAMEATLWMLYLHFHL